jgi:tetratricopeptide (TPR) repeat protein
MAESLLGGILGEEDETPELEAPETLVGAEAFAAAVVAIASRQDPQVARDTSAFLTKQSRLLDIQAQHLEDEHALRLAHLRDQRLGMRLRIGFQVFIALVATVIGFGVAVMLHDAFSSRSVVVEPFDAPPGLAARGLTGKVVAGRILDELNKLQNATRTSATKRDLSNAWAGEVKLAVAETGISLSDMSRLLKARFGHDLHIDGDLVETDAGGLALTVRGDGVPPKTFSGASGELTKLTTAAAEYLYSQSEPTPWAYYLQNTQRNDEAIAFCRATFASAGKADRPYLLNVWGNALQATGGSIEESLGLYRAALKLKPDYWVAYNNIMNSLWILGNEEDAWRAGEDLRSAAGGRPGRAPELLYQNWDTLTWNLLPWMDALVSDVDSTTGAGSATTSSGISIADVEARLHDPAAAELALATARGDANDPAFSAVPHFVRGLLALDAGDATRAASEMELFQTAYADPNVSTGYPGYACWVAPAEEMAGHSDKADAALKAMGNFVDCYRFRGNILDMRGDWAGAQKAYASAVALAPDLPAGYYSWGVALAKHGDLEEAVAKLQDANQKGVHWADPLKAWGDVLVKQGKPQDALVKYDVALKYAPNWKQLQDARDAAAKQKS